MRASREKRTPTRPQWVAMAGWPVMVLLGLVVLARIVTTIGMGVDALGRDLTSALSNAFPQVSQPLDLERSSSVQHEPIVDQLPAFTSTPSVMLQGHLPSFALGPDRQVEIALNGAVVARVDPDAAGRFAQQLTLRDGENTVVITLLERSTVISTTSATSVLDKTPPALSIVRPTNGETIQGETVVVEGKTEPGARVTVNERVVAAAPDGTFSESFTATAGAVPIEVVTRDQAGNETKTKIDVLVRAQAAQAGQRIAVSLDRTKVRPGEPVVADVTVLENGRPKANASVTLFVGVFEVGTSRTGSNGSVKVGFAAPTTEGEIGVVAIASSGSARATLTVAR
ncbi:MAG TPA: hypothetical protein VFW12_00190 [Candidatus Limnocylindria bacterium]|nr:hypothetical protein [Candidatus Limnocylindria bacterium]